jgi:SAM-dependent MidA family methyltransferase
LYGEGGFYSSVGSAGADHRGDFLTSPELGPLFGAVLARALDSWWSELGAPDPFVVVEAAAGVGTLARAVLSSGSMECASALRYLLVERSERLRERQSTVLPLEPASTVLGPVAPSDEDDPDGAFVLPGGGPRVASLSDLPAGPLVGVVLANELLDNLPFSLLERTASGWAEVRVGESADGGLEEVLTPASVSDADHASRLVPDAPVGARVPLQSAAADWLRTALRSLHRGRVVCVDYASTSVELARLPQDEWVRTYRGGAPGGAVLSDPGSKDITVQVCTDQLARVAVPVADRSQADFLAAHGLDGLVADAQAAWTAAAARPDVEALKARSRINEAAALTDPAGLGGFRVLEWTAG